MSIEYSYKLFYELLFYNFANHLDSGDLTKFSGRQSMDPFRIDHQGT